MAIDIRMPEIAADVEEADVLAWLVAPGDSVRAGDVLLEIETEKSTVEIESPHDGVLVEILVGDDTAGVAVGTVLARLELSDAAAAAPPAEQPQPTAPSVETTPVEPASPESASPPPQQAPPERLAPDEDGPSATALARRIADQQGVELAGVTGTGARGRITRADVEERIGGEAPAPAETPAPPPAPPRTPTPSHPTAPLSEGSTRVPLSRMRRTIAERLGESKRTIPHFYLSADCRIDALLDARRQLNDTLEGEYKVSVNDFIVRATAVALRLVPAANVSFDGDALVHHGTVDVAVAVATEGGLITPIVRNADRKGLADISAEVRDLAARARAGRLSPKEYSGGSFSVSNLGMYGIDSVYAIVNPPHAGILGVGQGEPRPVVEAGEVVPATVMTCTLSADHRAIDGAVGAEWLATFKRLIESPLEMSL